MQCHVLPGEWHLQLVGGGRVGQPGGVQCGIEQRGMDSHPVDLHTTVLGNSDLGEDLVPAPPHRLHALECRTVHIAPLGQLGVAL